MKKVWERKELWCFLGCSFSCSGSKWHSPSGCYSWLWSSCPSYFTTVTPHREACFQLSVLWGPHYIFIWWHKLPHILLWLFYHMSIRTPIRSMWAEIISILFSIVSWCWAHNRLSKHWLSEWILSSNSNSKLKQCSLPDIITSNPKSLVKSLAENNVSQNRIRWWDVRIWRKSGGILHFALIYDLVTFMAKCIE